MYIDISIHAPLAGRDGSGQGSTTREFGISIHAPLAGRDSKNAQILLCRFVKKTILKR